MKNVQNLLLITLILSTLFGLSVYLNPTSAQTFKSPQKSFGTGIGNSFTPTSSINVGETGTVRLTMYGADLTTEDRPPLDIMLVMDISGSMGWRWNGENDFDPNHPIKLEVAKQAMLGFVDGANASLDRIGLVTYSTEGKLVHSISNDFGSLKSKISALQTDDSTAIGRGLDLTNQHLFANARPDVQKVIVLATDGQERRSPSVYDGIIQDTKNGGAVVYSVGIGQDSLGGTDMKGGPWTCPIDNSVIDDGKEYLECAANFTGGKYYFTPNPDDLIEIYKVIQGEALTLQMRFEDYINTQYFENLQVMRITDLNNSVVSGDTSINGSKISGNLGSIPPNQGRIVYISVKAKAGSSGTSWTVKVDEQPDDKNRVNYHNPNDGSFVTYRPFNQNPQVTIVLPVTPTPTPSPTPTPTPTPTPSPTPPPTPTPLPTANAWFQGFNGGIYSKRDIASYIPNTVPNDRRYLINTTNTASSDIAVAQNIQTGDGRISPQQWTATPNPNFKPPNVEFDRLEVLLLSIADETTYNGHAPSAGQDTNGDGIVVLYAPSSVTLLNTGGSWLNINYPVMILVNGTTTIPDNIGEISGNKKISLGSNGFLLVASQNSINIDHNIGVSSDDANTMNLEGLFIAGQGYDASVGGTGERLNIAGSVVLGVDPSCTTAPSLCGYRSNRTMAENYLYPSDYYVYNPKLVINIPDIISQAHYTWKEVPQ